MCDYDEFVFICGHSQFRLKTYCHYARNDRQHHCFGVKKLRNIWDQSDYCDKCLEKARNGQFIPAADAEYNYSAYGESTFWASPVKNLSTGACADTCPSDGQGR